MSKTSKRRRDDKRRKRERRRRERNATRRQPAAISPSTTRTTSRAQYAFPTTPNYLAGIAALNAERDEEALERFRLETKQSPAYSMALGDSALALLALGRHEEAEANALEALQHFREHGCPHVPSIIRFGRVLGESLFYQGRYYEAIHVFAKLEEQARQLQQEHPRDAEDCEWERAGVLNSLGSALVGLWQPGNALPVFRGARDVYRKRGDRLGEFKALLNQAQAARLSGDRVSADLGTREAQSLAAEIGRRDLLVRADAAAAELGPEVVAGPAAYEALAASVRQHAAAGRLRDAFVVAGNWLAEAVERGDDAEGDRALSEALLLERHQQHDHDRARVRTWAARSRRVGSTERLRLLVEGARLWYASARRPIAAADFSITARAMHDHFRMLALELLERNRTAEALLAFEAGRALAHTVQVDRRFFERVVAFDHFLPEQPGLVLDVLVAAQRSLGVGELVVSIGILPPKIVAFIVRRDSVECVTEPLPADSESFAVELSLIASRLQERVGERALPSTVVRLAQSIARRVGVDTIRAVIPHSVLHGIPWRVVFRHVGVAWRQLACGVEFGLLARAIEGPQPALRMQCRALANGGIAAAGIDFAEEARQFAGSFHPAGVVIERCTANDVRTALGSDNIVLLSCHGSGRASEFTDPELVFALSDGDGRVSDVLPPRIQAPLVILSACESGVYGMAGGDFPVGAAPQILRSGAQACIGSRFRLNARFSATFFRALGRPLADSQGVREAVARASEEHERQGCDLWRELACLELLCR